MNTLQVQGKIYRNYKHELSHPGDPGSEFKYITQLTLPLSLR